MNDYIIIAIILIFVAIGVRSAMKHFKGLMPKTLMMKCSHPELNGQDILLKKIEMLFDIS